MATSVISNTLKDPVGTPLVGVSIIIHLYNGPGFRTDGSEVTEVTSTITNASGVWSLALERNADITPTGTYYIVDELVPGSPERHIFQVGSSNAVLSTVLVTPGSGTVTPVPAPEMRLPPDSPLANPLNATYGDEFDSIPLNAAWTKRNIAQAEALVAASNYYSAGTSLVFDAQGDAIFRPAPVGDWEIVAGFKCTGVIAGMCGLAAVDAVGTGVVFTPYDGNSTYMMAVTTYNYVATGPNVSGSPEVGFIYWLSLKKVGTNYTGRFSTDGVNWTAFTGAQTGPATADRIGILRAFTGSTATFTLHRFNVYPSPGFYTP